MAEDEVSVASLERSKRAEFRSILNAKREVGTLLKGNPSEDLIQEIGSYLEMWKSGLNRLNEIDNSLLDLIDGEGKTPAQIAKEECEITKEYETSLLEYTKARGANAAMALRLRKTDTATPRHSTVISNPPDVTPSVKLPEMHVPKFDGEVSNFTEWHTSFKLMIHENDALKPIQKLYFLKQALVGKATTLLKDYPVDEGKYDSAYNYIVERMFNRRVIIAEHFQKLTEMPAITNSSLRESLDSLNAIIRGLDACGIETEKMSPLIAFIVAKKLPDRLRIDWENGNNDYSTYPSFKQLCTFLNNRCFAYETSVATNSSKPVASQKATKAKTTLATVSKGKSTSPHNFGCTCCGQSHYLSNCPKFTSKTQPDRRSFAKEKHLCFNCLRTGHDVSTCRSSKCRTCGEAHHTLLHPPGVIPAPVSTSQAPATETKSALSLVTQSANVVLLPTAVVNVRIRSRVIVARVLIDACSQSNIVSESFVRKHKLKLEKSSTVVVGVSPEGLRSNGIVSLSVESRSNNYRIDFCAEVVGRVPYEVNSEMRRFVESVNPRLELADRDHQSPTVDILVGGEFANEILLGRKQFVDGLCFEQTQFGWVVAGPIVNQSTLDTKFCNLTISTQDALTKFWEVEEVIPPKITSSDHELCEAHFASTHSRLQNGRFQVRLPLKKDASTLANTYRQALRSLVHYETKLDESSRLLYVGFMKEYRDLGHMELVENPSSPRPYYIPHLPVLRPESSTTVLRVVFNASAKNASGVSLNQALLVGPVLQPDLFDILLGFRTYPVAFSADISKMYRQIVVHPDDRHLQSILWRDNPDEPARTYQLTTLTYGTAPASYIATKCMQVIGQQIKECMPEASTAIMSEFYMDDLLTGADTVPNAICKQRQIHESLLSAQFPLRKYVSNSPEFLQPLDPSLVELLKPVSFASAGAAKVLGLQWHPHEDELRVRVKPIDIGNVTLTKRLISSLVASIFDPLGLVTPFTIRGKILLQDLWREEKDWDDPVSRELAEKFRAFYSELDKLPQFAIKRPYFPEKTEFDLVAFCDASNRVYGAVVYVKSRTNREPEYTLVCSKTKVAPLKSLTIPRLELLGAVLLTKLLSRVSKTLHYNLSNAKAYCDSTIVLAWLKGPASRYETFVRNRIEFITSALPHDQWSYVNTSMNPADLLTRGIQVDSLVNNELWLHGPKSLDKCSKIEVELPCDLPEIRKKQPVVLVSCVRVDESIILRFSNFDDLVRITMRVLTYIVRVRSRDKTTSASRDDALNSIYAASQSAWFSEELHTLQKSSLPSRSPLSSLAPFIDDRGIIRVGGWLKNSPLSYDVKHPIILNAKSALAKLLARYIHEKYYHASQSFVSAFLKQRYWFVGGGSRLVKDTIKKCVWCTRIKAQTASQIMGDLPMHRVTVSRPFATSGVDFMGPFTIKCTNHRTQKRLKYYAAVFICFATRAVHLESVADLTTEAFISALQRFIGRRGIPHTIWSDNATNFVGTRNLIDKFCNSNGICWKFIPPRSPHHGGIWEAAVKVSKKHLLAATRDTVLTEDQLKTTLVVVESILNSRPLYAPRKENDPDVINVITPGHFLTGSHLLVPPEPERDLIPLFERLEYQRKIITSFWLNWKKDYLRILQTRSKWQTTSPNFQIGDIVLLKDDSTHPCSWPLGRIIAGNPDSKGHLRIVTIRAKNSEFLRAVQQLVKLPIEPATES